ncbi:MAG: hypothetical protein PHT48_09645 [Dechloromonas sp.]|nr:hypothetical protein [Dechloromonas sp.]
MIKLSVGQPYPLKVIATEGAAAEFLTDSGNLLQVVMPDIVPVELFALKKGKIKAGFMYQNGAMLWIFEFCDKTGPVLTFDAPFDARLIPRDRLQLHNIDNAEQRLAIEIHAIDTGQQPPIVKALRLVTLSPAMTRSFLLAVQEQMAETQTGEEIKRRWYASAPHQLAKLIKLETFGQ